MRIGSPHTAVQTARADAAVEIIIAEGREPKRNGVLETNRDKQGMPVSLPLFPLAW